MTMLSIIVPVHRVQPYLRECLDSILEQSFSDFEVIAVDDCSPDRCGEILDDYATKDPRLRIIHLTENVGLGRARNAGLAEATGTYVWFVDSDDWIAPGALQAIADRIRKTDPDVLMIEYARVYWTGEQRRNKYSALYADKKAPEVFRLTDRRELFDLFPSAWNKVVRRSLITDAGIQFPPGWYEDLPFTYPVLALADRISMLDLVCYFYRQRRSGGILRTNAQRHAEVLDQYERVFERLDRAGRRGDEVRPLIFRKAVEHGLLILRSRTRLPRHTRKVFFHQLAQFYRVNLPASGYPKPTGAERLRHGLVSKDAWLTYSALRAARIAASRARNAGRSMARAGRPIAGALRRARRAAHEIYYRIQCNLPLDNSLAVYSIYWGYGYGCNPAAIYEKARELAPHVRGVWVIDKRRVSEIPKGVPYVVSGSRRYFKALARAKWTFNNVNFPDRIVKRPGSIHVQTHHGTPLKIMGIDQQRFPVGAQVTNFAGLLKRCDRWDFSISSNAFSTEIWGRAYPCNYETLEYGYPRNDLLSNATAEQIQRIRTSLNIDPSDTVFLYAPTHREYHSGFHLLLDLELLAETLGPGARILVRAHHYYYQKDAGSTRAGEQIIDVSHYQRVEELYLAADVLITDYSSVMFDYAILDRPIVIYAPDWEAYRMTRGVYFDLLAEPPGAVATTQADLLELLRSGAAWDEAATKARAEFRGRYCHLDDGRAAERVVRRVILGEDVVSGI